MLQQFTNLFNLWGRVTAVGYLLLGVSLFIIKYLIDWLVASLVFGRNWSPLRYLVWPNGQTLRLLELPADEQRFGLVMVALALPFIFIGVALTVQRLRDASMPLWLILLFFVPLVNLLIITLLCLAPSSPSAQPRAWDSVPTRDNETEPSWKWYITAAMISSIVAAAAIFLSANLLKSYGFGVFVLMPFANGWLAALLLGLPRRRVWRECVAAGLVSLLISGLLVLVFAIEGLICMLMFLPLAIPSASSAAPWGTPCSRGRGCTTAPRR